MVEMAELSIVINDLMNYTIKIPKEITPDNFSEIMKRLKAVQGMLPKEAVLKYKQGTSPLLQLSIEESKKVYNLYKTTTVESFNEYVKEKYGLEQPRSHLTSLMGRVLKRITNNSRGNQNV